MTEFLSACGGAFESDFSLTLGRCALACGGDETPIHKSCVSWLTFTPVCLWLEMKMCLHHSYQPGFQWLSPGVQEWACDNCEKGHSTGWHKLQSVDLWGGNFGHEASKENLQCNCMIQCFIQYFVQSFSLEFPLCYAYKRACTGQSVWCMCVMDDMAGGMLYCSHVPSHLWGGVHWQ